MRQYHAHATEWIDFNIHRTPETIGVERQPYIMAHCKDKRVLDFGCVGHTPGELGKLGIELKKITKEYWGIDSRPYNDDRIIQLDVEHNSWDVIPDVQFDMVICGEIIEHLSNPGFFLDNLKRFNCPIICTVPSAFNEEIHNWMRQGVELVNAQHVAYYSYYTFCNLVERHGYGVREFFLSKRFEPFRFYSVGLIFLIEQLK